MVQEFGKTGHRPTGYMILSKFGPIEADPQDASNMVKLCSTYINRLGGDDASIFGSDPFSRQQSKEIEETL